VLVEAGAPVAHGGAVVGDQSATAIGLGVDAHAGSACVLGPLLAPAPRTGVGAGSAHAAELAALGHGGAGPGGQGGARRCVSSTHADHPGARIGRHSDHRDMVQLRSGPGHALAVGPPAATPGHFGETDAQAQRHAVSGQGQDLVPEQGVRDPPGPRAASARSSNSTVRASPCASTPTSCRPAKAGPAPLGRPGDGLEPADGTPSTSVGGAACGAGLRARGCAAQDGTVEALPGC
jgi:hypothetical protein